VKHTDESVASWNYWRETKVARKSANVALIPPPFREASLNLTTPRLKPRTQSSCLWRSETDPPYLFEYYFADKLRIKATSVAASSAVSVLSERGHFAFNPIQDRRLNPFVGLRYFVEVRPFVSGCIDTVAMRAVKRK
jgi:hypothetical protein